MAKRKKRDSAYWRGRLEREHPAIYAKLLSGEFPSIRAACAAAGLIRLPTRFDALKREWRRATNAQRKAFVGWLEGGKSRALTPAELIDTDGHLTLSVIQQLERLMEAEGIKMGQLMTRLGYSKLDGSLGSVMRHRLRPNPELLTRLAKILRGRGP